MYWENRLKLASDAYYPFKKIFQATKRKKLKQTKIEKPEEVSEKARQAIKARWERYRNAKQARIVAVYKSSFNGINCFISISSNLFHHNMLSLIQYQQVLLGRAQKKIALTNIHL